MLYKDQLQTEVGKRLNHRQAWELGNREEGYLTGLDSLIGTWTSVLADMSSSAPPAADRGLPPSRV